MYFDWDHGEYGLKVISTPSMAKCISIVRKYNPISMAEIKSAIESGNYIFTTSSISHPGVRKLRKFYDELVKNGIEVQIFEDGMPTTRELVSNLISSHRQTDREVQAQVDAEVAAEGGDDD